MVYEKILSGRIIMWIFLQSSRKLKRILDFSNAIKLSLTDYISRFKFYIYIYIILKSLLYFSVALNLFLIVLVVLSKIQV